MATVLNTSEIETLRAMELQAQARQIGYWQIYAWLADTMVLKGVSLTDSSLLWLRGATQANHGQGAMSALIRTYTEKQYQLRYSGATPSQGLMQTASNAVAQSLIGDLL